jgi:hypothetical protein
MILIGVVQEIIISGDEVRMVRVITDDLILFLLQHQIDSDHALMDGMCRVFENDKLY